MGRTKGRNGWQASAVCQKKELQCLPAASRLMQHKQLLAPQLQGIWRWHQWHSTKGSMHCC
jgi:hypothetical protein